MKSRYVKLHMSTSHLLCIFQTRLHGVGHQHGHKCLVSEFPRQPQSSHLQNGNISARTPQVKERHSCSHGGSGCSVQMQNTVPSKQGGRRGNQAASHLTNLIADWLNPPHPQPQGPRGSLSHPAPGAAQPPTLLGMRHHPLGSSVIRDHLLAVLLHRAPGTPTFCSSALSS